MNVPRLSVSPLQTCVDARLWSIRESTLQDCVDASLKNCQLQKRRVKKFTRLFHFYIYNSTYLDYSIVSTLPVYTVLSLLDKGLISVKLVHKNTLTYDVPVKSAVPAAEI